MPKFTSLFTYCPHCAAELIEQVDDDATRRRMCPSCSWIQYRNPTVGVAVIVIENDCLLIGQRRSGGWCIPCGHVEWDESIELSAIREFEEETGLKVELNGIFAVKSNFHDREHQTVGIWFRGNRKSGILDAGGDLTKVQLASLGELPELIFPTDREVVGELINRKSEWTC
jgi:ADP-ribose pyrophosphatase YjhB (NUDIX family)